jgi:hypothetical protein
MPARNWPSQIAPCYLMAGVFSRTQAWDR